LLASALLVLTPSPLQGGEGWGEGSRQIINVHSKREDLSRARDLRRTQTDAEKILWQRLRSARLGAKFRRQYPVDGFILDFYRAEARIAVELDGGQHADLDRARYDRLRTELLGRRGLKVLRFWNTEVLQNIDGVLESIRNELLNRLSDDPLTPTLSPFQGERE